MKCSCLDSARGIFDTMGVTDVFSWTSMVNGYAKSGELELGRMSFNEMPEECGFLECHDCWVTSQRKL
jgi:pentatricopeptide repeat protein